MSHIARLERPLDRAARVLVVDDSEEMRELLQRVLRRDGHDVAQAANGRDALRMLATGPFDLVLTDLLMPEMDGIELIRELTVRAPGTPIMVLSGADAAGSLLRAARVFGARVALEKSVSPAAIRSAVRDALGETTEEHEVSCTAA